MIRHVISLSLLQMLCPLAAFPADAIPVIARVLPPEGLEIPADVRQRLKGRLVAIQKQLDAVGENLQSLKPDVEVFVKAVQFALAHREFYVEKDFAKADWALDEAEKRVGALLSGPQAGPNATGLVVTGYRSSIDGSAQPFGLVIPEDHDFDKACPLYVWLHGRGDKNTDLHFLAERAARSGQITPPGAIVVHPFGRHCVGWKHAGEIDVLEVVRAVKSRYKIDPNRVVLIGFSMGGAGAWHIGAHYTDEWVAVSPGAGFAETARYQRLTPENFPSSYEQTLWGLYDVPGYVRSLFNTHVFAYSGELDKQIQAAQVMEEAFQGEGRQLTHLIGPGVEHKYEPGTLTELLKRLNAVVEKGRQLFPDEVHLQTRTLRYPRQKWISLGGLEEHWKDARVDAVRTGNQVDIQTKNVVSLAVASPPFGSWPKFVIDGQTLVTREDRQGIQGTTSSLVKRDGRWQWLPQIESIRFTGALRKHPSCQGPIDDAFVEPFFVVTPTGKSKNARFQAWVDFELAHFRDRWRALMRAELPEKKDTEFTAADEANARLNLVLFGDADSNSVIGRMLKATPVQFMDGKWIFGTQSLDGNRFVPALVFPRRFEGKSDPKYSFQYVVLNSGLTFREGHDRTNSIQNPKLPDWAIIDITQPPDAFSPGRIHDADFFDESWQLKRQPKGP